MQIIQPYKEMEKHSMKLRKILAMLLVAVLAFQVMLPTTTSIVRAEEAPYADASYEYVETLNEEPVADAEEGSYEDDYVLEDDVEVVDYEEEYYDYDYDLYDEEEYETEIFTLSNVPEDLTHVGQVVVVDDEVLDVSSYVEFELEVEPEATVELTPGNIAEDFEFLGWYRGEDAPEVGDSIYDLDQSNFVDSYNYSFEMPDEETQYFGLWGYRGMIGLGIGQYAIWSVANVPIPPTATTVAVRVSLDQTTNLGMGFTQFALAFDSPFLSNPRIENIWRLDFAAIAANPTMQVMYNTFSGMGWTHEQMANDPIFAPVRYNASANHGTFHPEAFSPMWHFGPGGHNITTPANVFVLQWQVLSGMTYSGSDMFVYVTFDVDTTAVNHYVGSYSRVRFIETENTPFMGPAVGGGYVPIELNDGRVTIEEDILTIENIPNIAPPLGQTPSGPNFRGTNVALNSGSTTAFEFFGWITPEERATHNVGVGTTRDSIASILRPSPHNFVMPESGATWIAVWGNQGVVGANLTINNQPAQAVRPVNQTNNQFVAVNSRVTLNPGTAPAGLTFGRWVRGDVIPPLGVNLEDWVLLPANSGVFSTQTPGHQTNIFGAGSRYTYTAVWVCIDDGIVGGANLRIRNAPTHIAPQNQTLSQQVAEGDRVTLDPGTIPAAAQGNPPLTFNRWIRGTNVPPNGVNINTWLTENAGVAHFTNPNHQTQIFNDGDIIYYTAVWVCVDNIVGGANLRIRNIPEQTPLPQLQTASQRVPANQSRVLAHGAITPNPLNLQFGRWIRGYNLPEPGDVLADWLAANSTVPNFGAGHTTQVFQNNTPLITYTAIWVCVHGVVGGGTDRTLTLTNVPAGLTHSGQSATAAGVTTVNFPGDTIVPFNANVSLTAGTVTQSHYFLGWYRYSGELTPVIGTYIGDLVQGNLIRATLPNGQPNPAANPRTFNMPNANTQYFALWGARGVVGAYQHRIIFDTYGIGEFSAPGGPTTEVRPSNTHEVPVVFGQPVNLNVVNAYMLGEDNDGAHAFWGWFFGRSNGQTAYPGATLSARTSMLTGISRNRPYVGSQGFLVPNPISPNLHGAPATLVFSQERFESLASADGSIHLYAIWSLWGDVDDSDTVNPIDANLLFQHIGHVYGAPTITLPPADVFRDGMINPTDANVLFQNVGHVYGAPPLGGRPPEVQGHEIETAQWQINYDASSSDTVSVEVGLYETTQHGMGLTLLTVQYDSSLLSNPRIVPNLRLDRDSFRDTHHIVYDLLSSLGYTESEMVLNPAFSAVVVDDSAYHNNFVFEYVLYPNHLHGPDVILLGWTNAGMSTPYLGSDIFVNIEFDVVNGAELEASGAVRFNDGLQYMGWAVGVGANSLLLYDGVDNSYVPYVPHVPAPEAPAEVPVTGDSDAGNAAPGGDSTANVGNNNANVPDNTGSDNTANTAGTDEGTADAYIQAPAAVVRESSVGNELLDSAPMPAVMDGGLVDDALASAPQMNVNEMPVIDEGISPQIGQVQFQPQNGVHSYLLLWAGLAALALIFMANLITRKANKQKDD